MSIAMPGWIHEDDGGDVTYSTPHEALIGYLMQWRGSYEDESEEREIEALDSTECRVIYMEEKTLGSEEQRENELIGMDDEESMIEMPIGGKYFRETKSVRYALMTTRNAADEYGGALIINYARKHRAAP